MRQLSWVLVADGSSDRSLIPIIRWTLRRIRPTLRLVDPVFLVRGGKPVREFVGEATQKYQPNVVFVHRDAEREPWEQRRREIPDDTRVVPVVPVRMTEAWLLIDEQAIRKAAGNPNGSVPLVFPSLSHLEGLPDPKETLGALLKTASGLRGRRLKKFRKAAGAQRVAELIDDFSDLHKLAAFRRFYANTEVAMDLLWPEPPEG